MPGSHFLDSTPGGFDFDDIYREAVVEAGPGARFVEVGSGLSPSTAFLAQEIASSGKPIQLTVVDHFHGYPSASRHRNAAAAYGATGPSDFGENARGDQVLEQIKVLPLPSAEAASKFPDDSLDFVFLKAGHTFAAARAGIVIWRRKVKPGGVLAGHDLDGAGVAAAVQDALPWSEVVCRRNSWWWQKDACNRGGWVRHGPLEGADHLLYLPYVCRPDLLDRAVSSLSPGRVNVAVLDGSAGGLQEAEFPWASRVGLFRAWPTLSFTQMQNLAQRLARQQGARWLLFMHADASCADGGVVPEMMVHAREVARRGRLGVLFSAYDALCVFDTLALEDTGAWDETFDWYHADIDYYRRLVLWGWPQHNWPGAERVQHAPSAVLRSDAQRAARAAAVAAWALDHYRHKWGGPPHAETHPTPYGLE